MEQRFWRHFPTNYIIEKGDKDKGDSIRDESFTRNTDELGKAEAELNKFLYIEEEF